MREHNRQALIAAAIAVDPRIEMLEPFTLSGDEAGAPRQLSPVVESAIHEVFRVLGGNGALDPGRLREWFRRLRYDDFLRISGDDFVVEYDEKQHFTEFRALTLASSLYGVLRVGFDASNYMAMCSSGNGTGSSGFAHNDSAHKDFSCPYPQLPRECRHRQRAFYDFLKDVLFGSGLPGVPRLIRISDREAGELANPRAAAELLRRRAEWATRV